MKCPILQAPDPRLHVVANTLMLPEQAQEVVQDLADTFAATEN